MAVSFRKRFAGQEEEIKAVVRERGSFGAMWEFDVKSWDRWDKYLNELMGKERFSQTKGVWDVLQTLKVGNDEVVDSQAVGLLLRIASQRDSELEETLKRITQLEAENKALGDMVSLLKSLLFRNNGHHELLEVCTI